MRYLSPGAPDDASLGVLIANLGSPAAPTPPALRRYLAQFLADPRVVEAPRLWWRLILHGVILRVRPRRSARAYRSIWERGEAPLVALSRRLQERLRQALAARLDAPVAVALGMSYGDPSIPAALDALRARGVRRLLVLPLFPQYSAASTGAVCDALFKALRRWRRVPALRVIDDYHDHPAYIAALADSVRAHWARHGRAAPDARLLLSFHGLPQRYCDAGDPYYAQCLRTADLLAAELGLEAGRRQTVFQSRFGREPWLKPDVEETLAALPGAGVDAVELLCPGFAVDCVETLEEIAIRGRERFLDAGGRDFRYIPALNDGERHVAALAGIVVDQLRGWPGGPAEARGATASSS